MCTYFDDTELINDTKHIIVPMRYLWCDTFDIDVDVQVIAYDISGVTVIVYT